MNQDLQYDVAQYFTSHDIGLVAYLLSLGFQLTDMLKTNPGKVLFVLKKSTDLEIAIKDYWDMKTQVDAQIYFNNLKRLKNQIFSSNY